MKFINTLDIESWANTVECQFYLPLLIRKLILATIDNKPCFTLIQLPK